MALTLKQALAAALKHQQAGDLPAAQQLYEHILRKLPNQLDAVYQLGMVAFRAGNHQRAIDLFRKAVEIKPDLAPFHAGLAMAYRASGELDNAVDAYRKSLQLDPTQAVTYHNFGNALLDRGDVDQSVEAFREAIALRPNYASAYARLGVALLEQGDSTAAMTALEHATNYAPKDSDGHNNLGNAYRSQSRPGDAIAAYRRALELDPNRPDTYFNLGVALEDLGRLADSYQCHQNTIKLDPTHTAAIAQVILQQLRFCDWSNLDSNCEQLRAGLARGPGHASPFVFLTIPSSASEQHQCAKQRARQFTSARQAEIQPRAGKKQLTIGYLSADFRRHPVAALTAEMFEQHNRNRFQINAYSFGPDDGSQIRHRLVSAFDEFIEIGCCSHQQAAERIRIDGVDILVDLMGYTEPARTEILSLRPAPIQVNYLGYPGTLGADFIDYILVDEFVVPPTERGHYTEQLVYLPGSYLVNDSQRPLPKVTPRRDEVGLPPEGTVFCCFNKSYKFNPPVMDAWSRLLTKLPNSYLWLSEPSELAKTNLRREVASRGIDPNRIIFAARTPTLDDHLARIRCADLFLDTWPYNAHTTASDALWVGCPVLTWAGETFPSRVAGSLLQALGIGELVAASVEQYEQLAVELATNPDRLQDLRDRLEVARVASGLFDGGRFARDLERTYEAMWQTHIAGLQPKMIRNAGLSPDEPGTSA